MKPELLFTELLEEAGVPVTEAQMQARWKEINDAQGGQIQNDSKWSPFWRLVSAIVTAPCQQLVQLLVRHALPNIFLRYASGPWLNLYAWGVDLERKPAVAALGQLTVTRTTSSGELFVPQGTVVESPNISGRVYRVQSTADVTIPDGVLTAQLPVAAEKAGTAYNLGPGYYSILAAPVSGVQSVANGPDWLQTPGADEEEDEELRLRCRNQFSAVGQYHHDAAYTAEIAAFASIRPDYIWFEHGAPRGPGSANCFVMIRSGAPSQTFVDTINAHIRDSGNHGHGDDLLCFPMPESAIDLTATVYPAAHVSADRKAALLVEVENRVRCAFRENADYALTQTWPYSRFSFSQLDKELHEALPDLLSVEFDQSDIVTQMCIPKLGTLRVVDGVA